MSLPFLFFVIFLMLVLVGISGAYLFADFGRTSRLSNRIELVTTGSNTAIETEPEEGVSVLSLISRIGNVIARTGILSTKTLQEMTVTLEAGGFKGGRGLGLFIGAKLLLTIIVPIVLYVLVSAYIPANLHIALIMFGMVMGLLAPDKIVSSIRAKHIKQVAAGVPDALDMLVICSDAGLALEAGLARVATELSMLNKPLCLELTQTSRELQIGSDMRRAMESLGQRTGLEPLKRLATTLAQSLQYGTPMTASLRSLSAELRQDALIQFEERAGKLPTLMTVPMIFFILPCVFLIVAGPAIINVLAISSGPK
jgi:tight adherence protein C